MQPALVAGFAISGPVLQLWRDANQFSPQAVTLPFFGDSGKSGRGPDPLTRLGLDMTDLKTAHEQALKYVRDDNLVTRTSIDRYLSFLEACGYVIAPVTATEEMCRRSIIWPGAPAEPYAEMIAARPRREASSCSDAG